MNIPTYEASWELPVKSSVLRGDASFKERYDLSRRAIEHLTGVDYTGGAFATAVAAIDTLRGDEEFDEAAKWLIGTRYWQLASQPLEIQRGLPGWFWERSLEHLNSASRFEALIYVSRESFEAAIDRWANKPEGVPLASINYYRKQRGDGWAQVPEHTFFALYGG